MMAAEAFAGAEHVGELSAAGVHECVSEEEGRLES
jgi:hypothetical protein